MGTSAQVRVVAGPARSGKTARLLTLYRSAVADGPIGSALWLSPNYRAARLVRQQILADGLAGCFSPNCLTFDQLATHVLNASDLEGRPISLVVQRQILRRLVNEAVAHGRLPHFAPIAATNGFLDLLVNLVQELKRLEIWPDEFRKACGPHRIAKGPRAVRSLLSLSAVAHRPQAVRRSGAILARAEQLRSGPRRPFAALAHVFVERLHRLHAHRARDARDSLRARASHSPSRFRSKRRTLAVICSPNRPPRSISCAAVTRG